MPGGAVNPLSERAKKEIRQRFPTVPMDRINRLVEEYRIYKDHHPKSAPSRQVKTELEKVVKQTSALKLTLATLSEESLDQLAAVAVRTSIPHIPFQAVPYLQVLLSVAMAAHTNTPPNKSGAREKPEGGLIRNLDGILRDAGEANADNGKICLLVEIILDDSNHHIADIPDLVGRSLGKGKT